MTRPTKGTPNRPRNCPGHTKTLIGLWIARDGLNELLEAHRAGASSAAPKRARSVRTVLRDARGLRYQLEHALAALEGELFSPDGAVGLLDQRVYDGEALPDADALARAILGLMDDDDTGAAPDDPVCVLTLA